MPHFLHLQLLSHKCSMALILQLLVTSVCPSITLNLGYGDYLHVPYSTFDNKPTLFLSPLWLTRVRHFSTHRLGGDFREFKEFENLTVVSIVFKPKDWGCSRR
jgi:hypothetical protein